MPRQNTTLVRVVAAVVVAALIGATLAFVFAGDGRDTAEPPETTLPPNLSPEARELLRLLERRERQTYHARYVGSSPEAEQVVLETWQDPPRVRQDSEIVVGTQAARTTSLVLPSGVVRCNRVGDAPWECQRTGGGIPDPLAAIRARVGESKVESRATHRRGRAVRCYTFAAAGEENELCVIPETGIPVLVRAGGSELSLDVLDESVDDEVFQPPAEVTDE